MVMMRESSRIDVDENIALKFELFLKLFNFSDLTVPRQLGFTLQVTSPERRFSEQKKHRKLIRDLYFRRVRHAFIMISAAIRAEEFTMKSSLSKHF